MARIRRAADLQPILLPLPFEFKNGEEPLRIEIPLTRDQVAIVDAVDADLAEMYWQAAFNSRYSSGGEYVAMRKFYLGEGKSKAQYMHRIILSRMLGRELLRSDEVDHIDLNPLHNWRSNLRLATRAQNGANRSKQRNNTSGFKGVSWHPPAKKWRAVIQVKGKQIFLGLFLDPKDAYAAYCEAAKLHYGEFARLD